MLSPKIRTSRNHITHIPVQTSQQQQSRILGLVVKTLVDDAEQRFSYLTVLIAFVCLAPRGQHR
jgi:hypothetical protein